MQLREDVTDSFVIQLIQCNGKILIRNFGLAIDGMNPFGNLSTNHSCWPVILFIYNLSPGLCMKRKYMMLSMMISGPKQPGNDIDVYLKPLDEDLKLLWLMVLKYLMFLLLKLS